MADPQSTSDGPTEPFTIDTKVAHPARVYDYLLGGSVNFAIDREVAEHMSANIPGGIATVRANVHSNRKFLERAIQRMAGELGLRQFIDVGTGIPDVDNVHGVAQRTSADCRIVYFDNDPVVLAHAHNLLKDAPEGSARYCPGDLRKPDEITRKAGESLDFTKPIAVVLVGILHFIRDEDDPHGIVTRLLKGLPSGSHVVISHLTPEIAGEMGDLAERANERSTEDLVLRTHDEVLRFFDGLELVEPGLVLIDDWPTPASGPPPSDMGAPADWVVPLYGGIGRKP